jgi:hypothetical protein
LTFECEWKAKLLRATIQVGWFFSAARGPSGAACTFGHGVWYSWLAYSALQPEDAHTLVSFTATSETLAHHSLHSVATVGPR